MASGFPVTTASSAEIVLASVSGQRVIKAVDATPGWHVIDEFPMTRTVTAGLDVLGVVSHASLTINVRVFDLTTGEVVEGLSTSITATTPDRSKSGRKELTAGHRYQLQAECVGDSGTALFGVIQNAALSN